MRIVISGSTSSSRNQEVEKMVKKLFPNAKVVLKYRPSMSDLENSYVLDPSNVYDKSNAIMARKILDNLDLGVSDSVLNSL